jgi:ABC-2 type transport system ATP-binding protein
VSVRFGDRQVLDGISFTVPPGEVVGLLGPNGAGKTTTMRTMFDIVTPDAGVIRWGGREAAPAERRRWGYMPQERGLHVKMTVRDHLVYFARLRGADRSSAQQRAGEAIELVGLADRADDKIEQLSGGMAQRVQLAAALVHDPDVLVLDEPFSGLDPSAVEQLSGVIVDQAKGGRTVVFSSHQLDLVEDLCERIVLVSDGRVVLDGELAALKAASPRRMLRIGIQATDPAWASDIEGAELSSSTAGETLLQLDPEVDPLRVLDQVRAHGTVHDFGLELPRLSELFREAVAR